MLLFNEGKSQVIKDILKDCVGFILVPEMPWASEAEAAGGILGASSDTGGTGAQSVLR